MKRRKNGFTLIELLAVIVILGILMIAAIPAISNAITKSRKDTFVTNSKKIIDAVRISMASGETKELVAPAGGSEKTVEAGICQYPEQGRTTVVNLVTTSKKNEILPFLLERGGDRSSFGQTYTNGYVVIANKGTKDASGINSTDYYDYYISLVDAGGNGIPNPILEDKLVRGNVQTSQSNLNAAPTVSGYSEQYRCTIQK